MKKQWMIAFAATSTGVCMIALLLIATVFSIGEQMHGEFSRAKGQLEQELLSFETFAREALELVHVYGQEASSGEETTDASTRVSISVYEEGGALVDRTEGLLPEYLIGQTREGLARLIPSIYADVSDAEGDSVVISATMTEFSSECVEIEQVIRSEQGYYIRACEDVVVVYTHDGETVFEETGIVVSELEEEQRCRLLEGIFVRSREELVSLLEAYTS